MNLPEVFRTRMSEALGSSYGDFIASFELPAKKGVRLSTAKLTPDMYQSVLSDLGQSGNRVPWTSCGFYYSGETSGKDPYYHAGVYYPQEPSAMLPAEVLSAKPGEIILDLCAAPGGKACRIGEDLKGSGLLVANEINADRSKALNRNIERSGITNCVILNETPQKIASRLPGFFDKILIDAPCSGEGMFRRDPHAVKSWEDYGPDQVSKLQFEIITEAAGMLKPGGEIVYSTCTFAKIEDEDLINRFLETHPEFIIVPHPEIEGVTHNDDGTMRIWPHLSDGDGHFCAHLKDTSDKQRIIYDTDTVQTKPQVIMKNTEVMLKTLREFLTGPALDDLKERCMSQLLVNGAGLYLMPVNIRLFDGLRIVKSGLFLGEIKTTKTDRVFVPSNSFPLTLDKEKVRADSLVSFDRNDIQLEKYLKGETIVISDGTAEGLKQNGTVVIAVNGYPLGLGKISSGSIKNLYPKAWRLI
ncbi:MAG: RsmF rRNA methyltransferase first C-terminal domain-containing protein [Clostridiales bacterium]|nr:RsmF rRNA methyltransferase first C-terminal domain-containing protein [Clostridiales bacterium]